MPGSENESSYFIRVRGKVLGPYSLKQLNTLRARGQFNHSNEISTDGKTWESGATLDAMFASGKRDEVKSESSQSRQTGAFSESVTSGRSQAEWHYSVNGEQRGPVSLAKLIHLLETQQLSRRDLAWTEGMAEWQSIADIPELNDAAGARRQARQRNSRTGESATTESNEGAHFLDNVISWLNGVFSEQMVTSIGSSSVEVGRYTIYLAAFLGALYYVCLAVKVSTAQLAVFGATFAIMAIASQFSAVKSCAAIERALRTKALRISSRTFFDSLLLIVAAMGFNTLLAFIVHGVQFKQSSTVLLGVGVFIVCEQFALMLLHPNVFGINVSSRATSGEDAITILAFFLLLPLRFVSAVLVLGTIAGCLGLGYATFLVTISKSDEFLSWTSLELAIYSGSLTITAATFPLLAYVYFVFMSLILDLVRSILIIPEKLDAITVEVTKGQDEFSDDSLALDTSSIG